MIVEIFDKIYKQNLWTSGESRSGSGSEIKNTEALRKELSIMLKKYEIKSMLDIPCGDYNWMKEMDLTGIDYIGADIVPDLIARNKNSYPDIDFKVMNLIEDELPAVDLIFVRDCLGHLSNTNVIKALENIKRSGAKYMCATTFCKFNFNTEIIDGGWKCINLMIEPFYLTPIYLINEHCKEGFPHYIDKSMILVKVR